MKTGNDPLVSTETPVYPDAHWVSVYFVPGMLHVTINYDAAAERQMRIRREIQRLLED